MRALRFTILLAPLLLMVSTTARAVPIISVDIDPSTAGIQSALNVSTGSTFTVDVVISDDGLPPTPTVFDTVLLEVSFNDAGAVLGLGPTGPVAGALAGSSILTSSLFGPAGLLVPGTTVLGTGSSFPAPGFASGSGAIGLLDPITFAIGLGPASSIFSLDFTAGAAPGTSTILAGGSPPGSPELSLAGASISALLAHGTVTVTGGTPAPEPGTMALLGMALAGMTLRNRRRRRNEKH